MQRRRVSMPYTRNRRSAFNSSTTTTSKVVTTAMKEVILLRKPNEREIPKYGKIWAVLIDKNWPEQELRNRLATIFADKPKIYRPSIQNLGMDPAWVLTR